MKEYIKPEVEVNEIRPEGLFATSFGADSDIKGPMGVPPSNSYSSDNIWDFDYS